MKRIYCNKLEVWKYAVTGHRFFNKTMSRIITFVIVTSCVVLPAFGALSKAGLRQIVTIGGKIACNTFCPAGFYDKPLYYYAENTHPAVIVFGNIFPFVRFMAAGAGAEAGYESGRTEWEMSCDLPGGIAYREVVAANIYVDNENNPDSVPNPDNKDISGDENNCGSGEKIRLQLQEVAAAIMMTAHRGIMETPEMNRAAHRRIIFSLPEVFHGLTPLFLMPMKA